MNIFALLGVMANVFSFVYQIMFPKQAFTSLCTCMPLPNGAKSAVLVPHFAILEEQKLFIMKVI